MKAIGVQPGSALMAYTKRVHNATAYEKKKMNIIQGIAFSSAGKGIQRAVLNHLSPRRIIHRASNLPTTIFLYAPRGQLKTLIKSATQFQMVGSFTKSAASISLYKSLRYIRYFVGER